jgi:hypothetical protein
VCNVVPVKLRDEKHTHQSQKSIKRPDRHERGGSSKVIHAREVAPVIKWTCCTLALSLCCG